MSEEEKKAIAQFKEINLEDCMCEKCLYQELEECRGCPTMIKEILLNLIDKQDKMIKTDEIMGKEDAKYIKELKEKIEKQDKMIDFMAMRIKGCMKEHHNKNISKKEIKKQFYMMANTTIYIDNELEKSRKKVEEDD